MNCNSVKPAFLYQIIQPRAGKFQYCRVPGWLSHTGIMDVESICKTDILVLNDIPDLIFQIRKRSVPIKPILMYIAKRTLHRTSLLAADRRNPFVHQVYIMVVYALDLFSKTEKICFDIVFFTIVTDCQKLKAKRLVKVNLSGVC